MQTCKIISRLKGSVIKIDTCVKLMKTRKKYKVAKKDTKMPLSESKVKGCANP